MKKYFIFAVAALGMLACTGQNNPENPSQTTDKTIEGELTGAFSVSPSKKVHFSQGNLQYQASTNTWRFAEHQYDFIGENNTNISDTYDGWIDLFGWGTGNNPTPADYEDYAIFTDWGVNKISNGGNQANIWRTLTIDEWGYLLYERDGKTGQATVDGVHGYILLPDSWALPSGLKFTADPYGWGKNVYTISDWSKMEKAGAIFLPAAGWLGYKVFNLGEEGNYWSSTPNKDNSFEAWSFYFDYYLAYTGHYHAHSYYYYRSWGRSVRLVQDVK